MWWTIKPWWAPDMRGALAILSTLLFAWAMLSKGTALDADMKGAIILQWGAVMGYYFGSSMGSKAKDATLSTTLSTLISDGEPPSPAPTSEPH